jgi:hypothetical protein
MLLVAMLSAASPLANESVRQSEFYRDSRVPIDDSALRPDMMGDLRACACPSTRDSTQKVERLDY